MSNKVRWTLVAAALAACAAFVATRKGNEMGPAIGLGRPADQAPADPSKVPQVLKIVPQWIDFGEIALGDRKTITVMVENSGKKPVTVFRTVFTCSCLSGGMDPAPILPGRSEPLNITFTGTPGKRSYHTVASIVTDEEGPCRYDIGVDGKIQQDFILEPETLAFGAVEKDATKSMDAIVRRRDGAEFTVAEVKSPRAEFTFAVKSEEEGKKKAYRITATAKALRPGTVTETAAVLSNEFPPQAAPVMTLSLEVKGDFACTPPVAMAGAATDGRPDTFETTIRHRTGGKVKVEAVREAQERSLEFVQEEKPDGSCLVRIRFKALMPSGIPFGEFLISVAGEAEPVHLPYRMEAPAAKTPDHP